MAIITAIEALRSLLRRASIVIYIEVPKSLTESGDTIK